MILKLEPFERLTASRTDDSQGGRHAAWSVSGTFEGCAVIGQTARAHAKDTTKQHANMELAEPTYTIFTKRGTLLPFHAVVRRVKDGRVFRITGDGADAMTPKSSRLDLRMHAAEEWRLPHDQV
ncbi:MAG TPA: hypothetical protein DDX71_00715 [Ruminococcus sp.]|nr:hypothetical protein [Ruminococcus sp.]